MRSNNPDNNYLSFDSTTFIHVFHDKNRFTKIKRISKSQRLLDNIETIPIKD